MTKTNIQHRVQLAPNCVLKRFAYDGKAFAIAGISAQRDLIFDENSLHYQQQYRATADDGNTYEVYAYYYRSVGNGRNYAVVDAIRDFIETEVA